MTTLAVRTNAATDLVSGAITVSTRLFVDEVCASVHHLVIRTTDEAVREALIKLGWKPPK